MDCLFRPPVCNRQGLSERVDTKNVLRRSTARLLARSAGTKVMYVSRGVATHEAPRYKYALEVRQWACATHKKEGNKFIETNVIAMFSVHMFASYNAVPICLANFATTVTTHPVQQQHVFPRKLVQCCINLFF